MPFIFLAVFIFIVCSLNFFTSQIIRKDKERSKSFWERESKANATKKQDLSSLPFLTLDESLLSFSVEETPALTEAREQVFAMKGRKLIDLSKLSNTDLKLTYGAANLPALTQYEENFFTLCAALQNWAEALSEAGYTKEAIQVLNYALLIGSDLSSTRSLLTKLCRANQTSDDTQTSFK